MKERIEKLLQGINRGLYEKESETALALMAALAGESIILLGPPGIAKSMVARRLKLAFNSSRSFEYLMSRFSTPDEIFGPVSISRLKSDDRYERVTDGYLPTADVVFLDEIWKAGPAIQNTLLTVINEKTFRNGTNVVSLPLKLLIAASNELPAQGEGLEALWDRFIIRLESRGISSDDNFNSMLLDDDDITEEAVAKQVADIQITNEEYTRWSNEISNIAISANVLDAIAAIRRSLRNVRIDETDERRNIYVSDRRWKNIARLLRTSAFMHDRNSVELYDLLPLYHCLWQETEERDAIRLIVIAAIFSSLDKRLAEIKQALDNDIQNNRYQRSAGIVTVRQKQRDANKKTYNNFFYRLPSHETGHSFVVMTDFQKLPAIGYEPEQGILYHDKRNPKATVIRAYADKMPVGARPVSLARDDNNIYVDGVRFEVEQLSADDDQTILPSADEKNVRDYDTEIDNLADDIRMLQTKLQENIFTTADDKNQTGQYLKDFFKEIAFTRQDIMKLYA